MASPLVLPCWRISAIPAALLELAGGVRLICAITLVAVVEVVEPDVLVPVLPAAVVVVGGVVLACVLGLLDEPPLRTTISTTATTTASAASPRTSAPPRRELRRSGGGPPPGSPLRDATSSPSPSSSWAATATGAATGSERVASTGISGSGPVAIGVSSEATTRAHARSAGDSAGRSRVVSLTLGGKLPQKVVGDQRAALRRHSRLRAQRIERPQRPLPDGGTVSIDRSFADVVTSCAHAGAQASRWTARADRPASTAERSHRAT